MARVLPDPRPARPPLHLLAGRGTRDDQRPPPGRAAGADEDAGAGQLPTGLRARLAVVLCDAEDTLFPSREAALAGSVDVTNRLLAALGSWRRCTAEELRPTSAGSDFRSRARELAAAQGVVLLDLDRWVEEEGTAVTAHLARALRPDPDVRTALTRLATHYPLAAVGSGPVSRMDSCFTAAGLDDLIGPAVRFSAEDSPPGRPDPAGYRYACHRLGVRPSAGLVVEDAVTGVAAAVAAGCPVVGNLAFVPPADRPERAAALRAAGAVSVVPSWSRLADLLLTPLPAAAVR